MYYLFVRLFIYTIILGLLFCLVTENEMFLFYSLYLYLIIFIGYIYRYSMFLFPIKKSDILPFHIGKKNNFSYGVTISLSEFVTYTIPSIKNKSIPPFLFRTGPYTIKNLPQAVKNAMDISLTLNPTMIQIYISNKDADQFLKTYYPEYSSSFSTIIPGAYKSDLLRLIILYHYGGYYNDLGHIFKYPLTSCFDTKDELILVNDITIPIVGPVGIHNAFMACYPRHPVIKHMLLHVHTNIQSKTYGISPLDITGPTAIYRAFNHFFKLSTNKTLPVGIHTLMYSGLLKEYYFRVRFLSLEGPLSKLSDAITDEKNNMVIQTKFPDYYNVLYKKRNMPRYDELWLMGILYNS